MKKFVDEYRPQVGWAVGLVAVFLIGLTAASNEPATVQASQLLALSDVEQDQIRDHAQAILDILGEPSTTTSQATTTSGAATTQPTTTTAAPTTTTTTAPAIPDTIIHPGINSENGYRIGVTDLDTGTLMWSAPYHHELLYQPNTGWRNGDRIAYHCAYGPLLDNGVVVGRFTFRAVPSDDNNPQGAYIRINDTFMEDAPGAPQDTAGGPNRFYDMSIRPADIQTPFADCPQDVGVAYEPGTVDEDPIIAFWNDGRVIEIRDYRNVVPGAGVTFEELAPITEPFQVVTSTGTHTVNNRRTVLARLNGLPIAVVYYDGLGTGTMFPEGPPVTTTTQPATTTTAPTTTTVPPTTTTTAPPTTTTVPNPADCNVVVSMSQGRQVFNGTAAGQPAVSPLEASTGEEWMLLFSSGKTLSWFTTPGNWDLLDERHRCGTDAQIDRVVFLFDPFGSGSPGDDGTTMTSHLDLVVGNANVRYSNAEIALTMLVGSDGHVACTVGGQTVRASTTHAARIGQLNLHLNAGADLDVPCSEYADGLGHLTNAGAANANGQLGAFYSGG